MVSTKNVVFYHAISDLEKKCKGSVWVINFEIQMKLTVVCRNYGCREIAGGTKIAHISKHDNDVRMRLHSQKIQQSFCFYTIPKNKNKSQVGILLPLSVVFFYLMSD
jgi:hypothetical protein